MQISSFVAFATLLALSPATNAANEEAVRTTKTLLESMSLEQKVGQLMIWTFSGSEFSPQIEEMLGKYQLGALIAFSRNIPSSVQIAKFNAQAQAYAHKHLKAPLMLMVDQEGGTVTRVRVNTPIPSALALGRMQNPTFAEGLCEDECAVAGHAWLQRQPLARARCFRSQYGHLYGQPVFGDDPQLVMETGLASAKGILKAASFPWQTFPRPWRQGHR